MRFFFSVQFIPRRNVFICHNSPSFVLTFVLCFCFACRSLLHRLAPSFFLLAIFIYFFFFLVFFFVVV